MILSPLISLPDVYAISQTPSSATMTEISILLAPMSITNNFFLIFLHAYRQATAEDEWITLRTQNPAILAASFMACIWLRLKQEGANKTVF